MNVLHVQSAAALASTHRSAAVVRKQNGADDQTQLNHGAVDRKVTTAGNFAAMDFFLEGDAGTEKTRRSSRVL